MKIAVIGTGYVGLVTGTCFAETGNSVTCVDIDEQKVNKLKNGVITIYEPHLDSLFERNLRQGRLKFTTRLEEAVSEASIIFLALPTPPGENGSADTSYVMNVATELGKIIKGYKVIVNKSTVPVGTTGKVHDAISKSIREFRSPSEKIEFDVISNPEFLREGFAVDDFMKPDRVVVGSSSERANKTIHELYSPYVRQGNPIYFMDERSAELTKYAANAFLATKITFMNEIANLCEKVGANVDSVRIGIGSDQRIGKRFLFAGIGYGGSCFPKDVKALLHTAEETGYDFKLIRSVIATNDFQKIVLVSKMKKYYDGNLKEKKIALWGLAFKPDTDDIREAPALFVISELLKEGATIQAFDPEAMQNVKNTLGDQITYCENQYDALTDADALIIATEWSVFRTPDFDKISQLMRKKVIFDGRNLYDTKLMSELGFYYNSIGRPGQEDISIPIKIKL